MSLLIPGYIQSAGVEDREIRFFWDDWNTEQADEPIEDELYEQLQQLSERANVAFAVGAAQWIVQRFIQLSEPVATLNYLEAALAQIVDVHYRQQTWEENQTKSEWAGPVRRPLWVAMTDVRFSISEMERAGNPSFGAAWAANLAKYVMKDPSPFLKWRDLVVRRFRALYPRKPDETVGEVVPREALDPTAQFHLENTEELINRFLGSLNHRSNPFLKSPEAMKAEHFEGVPYVFSIEQDRKQRFEW